MANNLFNRQNEAILLKSLVSQRRLYSSAKNWGYAPGIITVLLAVVAFFWHKEDTGKTSLIVAAISFVGWALVIFGEKYGEILRLKAARIQQYIDREIFKEAFSAEELVSWHNLPLAGELSEENAKVTDADIEKEKVRNWYSDYSKLTPSHAVFLCQRENLRWDKKLRVLILISMLLFLSACVFVWSIKVWNLKVCEALPVLIASAGVVSVLIKIIVGLVLDLVRMGRISTVANVVEVNLQNGVKATPLLIQLQNLIYDNRCNVVLIPDFIYKMIRNSWQKYEDDIAEAHVEIERNGVTSC